MKKRKKQLHKRCRILSSRRSVRAVSYTHLLEYWHRTRGWTFTVITREAFAPVLEGHPAVRSIVGLAKEDLRFPRQLGVFRDLAEAHAGQGDVYKRQVDAVSDLADTLEEVALKYV